MSQIMRMFLLLVGAIATVITTARADDLTARVDEYLKSEMTTQKIPGVAVAVIEQGRVVLAKGYGLANVEHGVPVDADTIFQSGSLGKQFTAALIMLLAEDGKLAIEDPLSKYFPAVPESWRAITIRHLLTHTSGIPDYADSSFDLQRNYSEDELLRLSFGLKLEFTPGSRWNYSNTGYMLLGFVAQRVGGSSYESMLQGRIFAPLGMKTARVISEADIVAHRAGGYRLVGETLKNQEWVAPILNTTADGCLYFSLTDLIAWDQGWRSGALLSKASWAQMLSPVRLNSGKTYPYGFGIGLGMVNGQKVERHGGAWQGFKTYRARYLSDDFSVLVLANLAEADPARLSDGVAALVSPKTAQVRTPLADQEPAATERLKHLLADAAAAKLSPAELAYVRNGFFPEVSGAYSKLLEGLGEPQRISIFEKLELGDDIVYQCDVEYTARKFIVRMGVAADSKISELRITPRP
jgi:CubicO group peptidase (beta-lactamase class C family)